MVARKLNAKKKTEKNLTQLIKQIQANGGKVPEAGGDATPATAQDLHNQLVQKQTELLE